MNRQIKFRGKRTDTGMWTVGSLIPNGEKKAFIAPFKEQFHLDEVLTDTVGQFTGLLDKNGKEIYDGDILTFKLKATRWKPVVTWNNEIGAWCVKMDMQDRAGVKPLGEWLQEEPFVVIGNIYDNTSLLKGGKE